MTTIEKCGKYMDSDKVGDCVYNLYTVQTRIIAYTRLVA